MEKKRMYDNLLFDLDGTLTDPGEGITNSVAYALKKWGIEVSDRSELYKFIGPPLVCSFMQYYEFSQSEAEQAVVYYREYFKDIGIFENQVYDGVTDMLESLQAAGKKIILATSKPEVFAKRILEHFELEPYFDCVAGATLDGTISEKADVIAYALKSSNITDKSRTVMIGDRKHDIIGARANGLDSIGVLYGYGSLEELQMAGATYTVAEPAEILRSV